MNLQLFVVTSVTVRCSAFATAAFNVRNGHDVEPSAHHRGENDHRSEGIKS